MEFADSFFMKLPYLEVWLLAALAAVIASYLLLVLYDFRRIACLLIKSLSGGQNGEEICDLKFTSSLGRKAAQAIDAYLYTMQSLRWQLGKLKGISSTQYERLSLGKNVSELKNAKEPEREAYDLILTTLKNRCRAEAVAVIYDSPSNGDLYNVMSKGIEGVRFLEALKRFVLPAFGEGKHTKNVSVANPDAMSLKSGGLFQFGFAYCLIRTFHWYAENEERAGVLWLGFKRYPPTQWEREQVREAVFAIEKELPALFSIRSLSGRAEDAEKLSRAKSEFLAHMSHDIRAPLANIRCSLHAISDYSDSVELRELMEIATKNCDALQDLVSTLLDFSKHQAGKLIARPEVFDLRETAKDVVASFQATARDKGIALTIDSNGLPNWLVYADITQSRRILTNLVSNAIKFTSRGEIVISAARNGEGFIDVNVKDSGSGMNSEVIKKLFTPYESSDKTNQGVGLGLTICKIHAELNGGSISVSSKLSEGSVFTVSLPFGASPMKDVPCKIPGTSGLLSSSIFAPGSKSRTRELLANSKELGKRPTKAGPNGLART